MMSYTFYAGITMDIRFTTLVGDSVKVEDYLSSFKPCFLFHYFIVGVIMCLVKAIIMYLVKNMAFQLLLILGMDFLSFLRQSRLTCH